MKEKPPNQTLFEGIKHAKFTEVATVDALVESGCEICVCVGAEFKTPYTDNIFTTCHECKAPIQHRPYIPKTMKFYCHKCTAKNMADEKDEVELLVTPQTLEEVKAWLGQKKKTKS